MEIGNRPGLWFNGRVTRTIRSWVPVIAAVTGVWVGSLSAARAVIGDTTDDLYKRYGAGKEVGGQLLYKVDAYSASIYFSDKKSSMEIYSRLPEVDGSHLELTDSDVQKLLQIQGGSVKWNVVISKKGEKTWARQDGRVIARFKPESKALVFVDATLK